MRKILHWSSCLKIGCIQKGLFDALILASILAQMYGQRWQIRSQQFQSFAFLHSFRLWS